MRIPLLRFAALACLLLAAPLGRATAAETDDKPAPPPAEKPAASPEPKPVETLSETRHTATIGGRTIRYRALAGDLLVGDDGKGPKARMFYVAYLAEGAGRERPLTFLFNGGPGSSSVWLHLGAFGPLRVPVDPEGHPAPPPWAPVANPNSLLDVSDLVFIDPISTGYSRALPGQDEKTFHEVHKDVESVGELIRLFVTRHERWGSPLFLLGESYGTIRAAGLADYLQRRYSMNLSGVVLVSNAMNTAVFSEDAGNDLPYALHLPAYTAAAWYHKKLAPDLQADFARVYREAEEFALGPYSDALLRGADLPAARRQEIIERMARLTALPADEIDRDDLRVGFFPFASKLLEKEKESIGVLDSRYVAPTNSMAAASFAPDYSYLTVDPSGEVNGVFSAVVQRYLREDLKVRSDLFYEILSEPTSPSWDLGHDTGGYLNTAGNLRTAMIANRRLQVFVAGGRYDMVTTPLGSRYIIGHLGLPPELRGNISFHEYEGGHMMYMHEPDLARLKADLAAFYESATRGAGR
jgi:carboxypeptidase C (cathepsin A)